MRGQVAATVWDKLWRSYRQRVPYAQVYEQMIHQAGGTTANDHIAFRSLGLNLETADGPINLGIKYLARIAEALGYVVAGEYTFPNQHLYARHYYHPQQEELNLPKLFISELVVEALPEPVTQLIQESVASVTLSPMLSPDNLRAEILKEEEGKQLARIFTRPWQPPLKSIVETVNQITQYGAWVLLHGYAVNHFTGYVNRQRISQYPDIETTAQGLIEWGVPMKPEIEGDRRSGLRQTATQAVSELVSVRKDLSDQEIQIPWTYAYFEIAERGQVKVSPGEQKLFEGFLGPQASNLFEMTRRAI